MKFYFNLFIPIEFAITDGPLNIHRTEVISSQHAIFARVQKVKINLTIFKFYEKVQGFVQTLQIMSFQNVWQIMHRRGLSKGTLFSNANYVIPKCMADRAQTSSE